MAFATLFCNLVRKTHGTGMGLSLKISLIYSPYKPGVCSENSKRVVSNLSFTAKFDVTKTPDFERSQGFCGFWG